jgi:hypothetical protein
VLIPVSVEMDRREDLMVEMEMGSKKWLWAGCEELERKNV